MDDNSVPDAVMQDAFEPTSSFRNEFSAWCQKGQGNQAELQFNDCVRKITVDKMKEEDVVEFIRTKSSFSKADWWNFWNMPPSLQSVILGTGNRRTLRDDAGLFKLVKAGCFIDFMLGAWVDPPPTHYAVLPPAQAQELDEAFKTSFIGDGAHWMKDAIEHYNGMYNQDIHYGKMIAYVQSSATGKSRTLEELSTQNLMLTICFRDIHNLEIEPDKGWPPGDKPVCEFFSNPPKPNGGKYKGEELAAAFMGALMAVVTEQLKDSQSKSVEGVISAFREHWTIDDPTKAERSPRWASFEKVCKKAVEMLELNERELLETRYKAEPSSRISSEGSASGQNRPAKKRKSSEGLVVWLDGLFDILIRDHANALVEALKTLNTRRFIIAFDECCELNSCDGYTHHIMPADGMSLIALQRIIKTLDKYDMWHILVDTSSGMQGVHPVTGKKAKSGRLISDLVPLPVYPYIQWDIMAERGSPATPSEALRFEYLKNFGRPYWSTLQSGRVHLSAQQKLLCSNTFDSNNRNHVFAVFSARLLLELGNDEASTTIGVEAVESHMRILTGMASSDIVTTCAPSEPMLAVAAAYTLLESDVTYRAATSKLVNELILKGPVLERGLQGELIARILLMLARDSAIWPKSNSAIWPQSDSAILPESNSAISPEKKVRRLFGLNLTAEESGVLTITLDDFLTALLGKDLAVTDPDQKRLSDEILAWAHNYHLNFTHFVQLDLHIEVLSPEFLMLCWRRGVALACVFQQAVFDIVLVVYHGDLSKPFDRKSFGLVSFQVKLRSSAASLDLIKHLTCPLIAEKVDSKEQRYRPEHLVILMDLGTKTSFQSTGTFVDLAYEKVQGKTQKSEKVSGQWGGYLDEDAEPERYSINVRGLDEDRYPVIKRFAPDLPKLALREQKLNDAKFFYHEAKMDASLNPFRGRTTTNENKFASGI